MDGAVARLGVIKCIQMLVRKQEGKKLPAMTKAQMGG
jgi:hypothetical protein